MTRDNWIFEDDFEAGSHVSSPPPDATLRWVERNLGARITDVTLLRGGLSSAVHRLAIVGHQLDAVVLRRFTLNSWMKREPEIPEQEAHILAALSDTDVGVQTPHLLAVDAVAVETDVPAILMTHIEGSPNIAPANPNDWVDKLAACVARLHQTPAPGGLPAFRRWDDPGNPHPVWVEDAAAWDAAKALASHELPTQPNVFIHRDFHPNNIHWIDGDISGIVDWLSACIGPAAVDIAHCRWNLAMLSGNQSADQFLDHYRSLTGYSEDVSPYDVSTVLSAPHGDFPTHAWNELGRADLTSNVVTSRIERWLSHVLEGA